METQSLRPLTTQFAVAGLSAAANIIDGADQALPAVVNFLMAGQNADGSNGYRPGNGSSSSMAASALWCIASLRSQRVTLGYSSLSGGCQNWTFDRMVEALQSDQYSVLLLGRREGTDCVRR